MLIAKLGLDTTDYDRGISHADGITQKWAGKQEKYLAKSFFRSFGLAAALHELKSVGDEAARISKESAKLGLSTQDFQALEYAAEKTGIPIDALADKIDNLPQGVRDSIAEFKKLGSAISDLDLDSINNAMDRLDGVKGKSKTWTARILSAIPGALRKSHPEILAGGSIVTSLANDEDVTENLVNDLIGQDVLGSDSVRTMKRKLREADAQRYLDEKKHRAEHSVPAVSPFHAEIFDSLNRIGGFAQRGDSALQTPLQRIAVATERTAQNTSSSSPY